LDSVLPITRNTRGQRLPKRRIQLPKLDVENLVGPLLLAHEGHRAPAKECPPAALSKIGDRVHGLRLPDPCVLLLELSGRHPPWARATTKQHPEKQGREKFHATKSPNTKVNDGIQ